MTIIPHNPLPVERDRAWQKLEQAALEPAITATRAFAGVACEVLPPHRRPHLHFVKTADGALAGVFPLRHDRLRWWPLGRIATTHWGDMPFLGVPLVHAEHASAAFAGLFESARDAGIGALEFRHIPARGAFLARLGEELARRGLRPVILARWQRAVIDATRKPEDWWRQDVSKRRRKEWMRQRRRLEEQGKLTFERLEKAEDCRPWLEDLLILEKRGWKGRNGTALASAPDTLHFVRRMVPAFHRQGNLEFFRLRLDGRTIATGFGLSRHHVAWLLKIAYDERLSRHSPGVQLILELTRALLNDPDVRFIDSCAAPDHPMIDRIWRQRREMVDVLVPLPHTGRTRFAMLGGMERACRHLRRKAAPAWNGMRRHLRRRG